MKFGAISGILILMLTHFTAAQSLPSKIRGYKIYNARVLITNAVDATVPTTHPDATVRVLDPKITGVSLIGATLEIGAEITALKQSGSVDFITCHDLRVNGIAIETEEYNHPFAFNQGQMITLPTSAKITINTANIAKAAYKELVGSKNDWTVTGTVFVFGKFKKFGLSFKRVVPVKIDLTINNPLNSLTLEPR